MVCKSLSRATRERSLLECSRQRRDIREAIDKVAADPAAPNNNIRALKGVPNGFRIRVGDWRVSYTLDHRGGVMNVFEIAPRGGAYR
jgi:mRNA interferase RelE/StbE